jgi:hypothetical protein
MPQPAGHRKGTTSGKALMLADNHRQCCHVHTACAAVGVLVLWNVGLEASCCSIMAGNTRMRQICS